MSDPTAPATEYASVDRILHHAAQLVRPLAQDDIDPILDLADTVYSCWSFQIDVLTAVYEGNQAYLHEVDVTAEDIRATAKLPKSHKLSPMAFWSPGGVNRYGPGELLPARSEREAATRYTLDWTRNGGAYSILVGDIAATVARWRLNSRNLEYSQLTRTVPDDRSWQLCQTIVRWQDQYRNLIPQGMSLHPSEAIEYLRHLPVFTDALNPTRSTPFWRSTGTRPPRCSPRTPARQESPSTNTTMVQHRDERISQSARPPSQYRVRHRQGQSSTHSSRTPRKTSRPTAHPPSADDPPLPTTEHKPIPHQLQQTPTEAGARPRPAV